jgi:hypothetical protein
LARLELKVLLEVITTPLHCKRLVDQRRQVHGGILANAICSGAIIAMVPTDSARSRRPDASQPLSSGSCINQVKVMAELMQPSSLRKRILDRPTEEERIGGLMAILTRVLAPHPSPVSTEGCVTIVRFEGTATLGASAQRSIEVIVSARWSAQLTRESWVRT